MLLCIFFASILSSLNAMDQETFATEPSLESIVLAYQTGMESFALKAPAFVSGHAFLTHEQMSYLFKRRSEYTGFSCLNTALILGVKKEGVQLCIERCSDRCAYAVISGSGVSLPCVLHPKPSITK